MVRIKEVKSTPDISISNPFIEKAIGTIRRKFLDHTLFWNQKDLEEKLLQFQKYYNEARVHYSLKGDLTGTLRSFSLLP